MVTIHDVAGHAGVAVATVSRVVNNTGQVRDRTRLRVLAAVDELGYRPNRIDPMPVRVGDGLVIDRAAG